MSILVLSSIRAITIKRPSVKHVMWFKRITNPYITSTLQVGVEFATVF